MSLCFHNSMVTKGAYYLENLRYCAAEGSWVKRKNRGVVPSMSGGYLTYGWMEVEN
jgi:hypothetical protein